MKEEIKNNLGNPGQLEKMFRESRKNFRNAFYSIYPEIKENLTAQIWNERLSFEQEEISWGSRNDLIFVLIAAFIAGLIAKIPEFAGINQDYFYPRNIGFIVFPLLTVYFAWKQKLSFNRIAITAIAILASAFYINMLPNNVESDTLILACIHLPLFLWAILGITFTGDYLKNNQRRLDFLRYNGDLVVMTAVMCIAGGLLTGITLGLFQLIDLNIEKFYTEYIVVWGLSAAPIVGTYLVLTNPHLVNKVSPVIAKVFTPLVLVTLVIYLGAVIYTGKDPYSDREFLMIFNLLLIGVMAITLFSITETSKSSTNKIPLLMLFALSLVTIIVNGIALSAIIYRISEWGITPNRLAVLGSNTLMLINLLMVSYNLFKTVKKDNATEYVENSIASFLPVYMVWTFIVAFLFPVMFGFK